MVKYKHEFGITDRSYVTVYFKPRQLSSVQNDQNLSEIRSCERGFVKSILSLWGYWHGKKVRKMQFILMFEPSLCLNKRKKYGQLECGSQVEDVVIASIALPAAHIGPSDLRHPLSEKGTAGSHI